MKLSVIIPAFNEEKLIGTCLTSVFTAAQQVLVGSHEFEVIVCDNNSNDRTSEISRAAGAHVVFEPINQISRARNAGASAASGDWLLFIDADSRLHPDTLKDMLEAITTGNIAGGGCRITLDFIPWYVYPCKWLWHFLSFTFKWAAGSFVFCRADAFKEIGGFPLELYAAEEIEFSKKLKRWAKKHGLRLVILKKQEHVSSSRKLQTHGIRKLIRLVVSVAFKGKKALQSKNGLDVFYDGKR